MLLSQSMLKGWFVKRLFCEHRSNFLTQRNFKCVNIPMPLVRQLSHWASSPDHPCVWWPIIDKQIWRQFSLFNWGCSPSQYKHISTPYQNLCIIVLFIHKTINLYWTLPPPPLNICISEFVHPKYWDAKTGGCYDSTQ